jgi:5-methyltetrahydropteroyltriglutamate--homocysteine methyltransferase
MDRVGTIACIPGERPIPPARERVIVSSPVKTKGTAATQRQLACFKAAIARAGIAVDEAFVPALAPGWLDHFIYNEFYKTDEEFVYALADAMSDKYRAIVDAGFILQIDDPGIATSWDMIKPQPALSDYRKYVTLRIEALNHALAGIPAEKVRYHFCWGSWHGAHTNDIPLKDIVDIALRVKAQTCSFEAANVRHEHEVAVWKDVKLAPGMILMPGVISHATNIVEHPELVARRLVDFAAIVGRENVVAGADCGIGGRVHAEIGWAKLGVLAEGAALASKKLWQR